MGTADFDLDLWLEGPHAERMLSAWDRERHARLPTYRELHRDAALAYGRSFLSALAAVARGDGARAEALARRLFEDGSARGCSAIEVAAAFRIFERVCRAELGETPLGDVERGRAERQLVEAFLSCSNTLVGALAARLEQTQRNLSELNAEARRLRADREQVASLLRDDLNEAASVATAALASSRAPEEETRKAVLAACSALGELQERVERLREVERLEDGTSLKTSRVRVHDLLSKAVRTWEMPARRRDIAITLDSDTSEVEVDVGWIMRALDGCVENAIRFTPRRGRIRLDSQREGDRAVITIWDSGPPLHPDVRIRAFDKYWTGNQPKAGGRGLGLYVCRLVAERHGGAAWTDDEHGCCAFHLALPLAAAPAALAQTIS